MLAGGIQDIYPLTPLQRGLLFHAVADSRAGMYVEQLNLRLRGEIELDAFDGAWEFASARHPGLRTSFLWEDLDEPMQVVLGDVRIVPSRLDWSGLSDADQRTRLAEFLRTDRETTFDPAAAPLLRVTVIRLSDTVNQLICTNHHLILDGWSRSVLFADVLSAYEALRRGGTVELTPAAPYRKYVEWLRARPVEESERAWRELLADLPAPTPLPLEPPPARSTGADPADGAASVAVALDPPTTSRLTAACREQGITLATVAQAAWGLLLARHAGTTDALFGVAVAGRPAGLGLERSVGLFLNTVPARVHLDPTRPVLDWLRDAQVAFAESREHAQVPLSRIAACSEFPPGSTLFDSLVVVENYPIQTGADARVTVEQVEVAERTDVALTLVVAPEDVLHLRLIYDTARCTRAGVDRLLEQFQTLLAAIADTSARTVADLPLSSAAESHRLLAAWNPAAVDGLPAEPLISRFRRHAEQNPDAVALVAGDRLITYRALAERAADLAGRLRAAGAARDSVIAVQLPAGPDQVVALLGVQLAGGAYLPVDPGYPAARIDYLLEDSGTRLVVTADPNQDVGAGRSAVGVTAGAGSGAPLPPGPAADDLAYVIYTSGSTGRPKGVLIGHRQAARLFSATEPWFGFGPGDTWSLFHSASFDFSVWEMWGALAYGGRLVIVDEAVRRAPAEFGELLREQAVTVLNQTPSAFYELSAAAGPDLELPALRAVIFGGEALDPDRLAPWVQRYGADRPQLVNMYGITETTVHVTWHRITAAEVTGGAGSLIGTPIPDLRVYLLDASLRPVPVGVIGEIHVGGAGLARGYLGRPGLSADRFVPDPFSTRPGARLYRTGDLATTRADGTLSYARRGDDQVKIRGYRIELDEVAAALRACDVVRDGVVIVREDVAGEPRLVGYALPEDPALDPAEFVTAVREGLQLSLPRHMLPTAIVALEKLPLTPHGKLDRAALPAPGGDRGTLATRFAQPQGPVESALSRIWAEVLRVQSIGRDDNFFALGGDSIQSMQIALRAGREGLQLSPRQLFSYQTIAELAGAIATESPAAVAETNAADRVGPVPLTPVQQWFLGQDRQHPEHFNQAVLLRTDRPCDEAAIRAALVKLIRGNDALRLAFNRAGDRWLATVREPSGLDPLEVVDLSGLDAPSQRDALRQQCDRTHAGHDLAAGQLLRGCLIRLGGAGDRLLLSVHHLGIDAVSWPILLEQLAGLVQPGPGEAGRDPAFGWRSWAMRQSDHAGEPAVGAELNYWTRMVTDTPAALPADGPGGTPTVGSARTIERELSAEATDRLLREVPAASRADLLDVVHAAVGSTLSAWLGSSEVLVDVESHGRQLLPDAPNPISGIGWFTALHPLALAGGSPAAALGHAVRARRDVPGDGLGYGLLRYLRQDAATEPLRQAAQPEVLVNYLGRLDGSAAGDGSGAPPAWRIAEEDTGAAQNRDEARHHEHEITAGVVGPVLRLRWTYSPERTRPETVERLADELVTRIEQIAGQAVRGGPAATAADFPLAGLDDAALAELTAVTGPLEDLYPLSPMQDGMLFHLAYAAGTGVNVEQVSCQITGNLDPAAFRRAWDELGRRHPILRTSFHWRQLTRPLQAVHPHAELGWAELDWSQAAPAEQARRLEVLLAEDRSRPIPPEQAPLARVTLIRLAADRHQLLWTHHHLLLDGWSLARLLPELMLHYRAAVQGTRHEPAPRPPYRDYIAWLERQDGSAADALWRRMLADITSPTALPAAEAADRDPSGPTGAALAVQELAADDTAALARFAREQQLTMNTLVQAAWALLLSRHSGDRDVVFGSVVSGRPASLPGAEDMIGQFINTVPVRATVQPGRPVVDWLRDLQAELAEAREHEYVPLVRIHGCSGVPRDEALFETVVVFENYSVERATGQPSGALQPQDDLRFEELRGVEQTNYPLTLIVAPGDRLRLQVLYDPARYDATTAHRLGQQVHNTLLSLSTSATQPVSAVELLDADERAEALALGADTTRPLTAETTLLSLFADAVARTPDAPALASGSTEFSYAELAAATDRFAARLRAAGAGRGEVVALFAERSVDLVVAILGTFTAGAAYVPVDTTLAPDRVRHLLTDSRAKVVVSAAAHRHLLPDVGAAVLELDGVVRGSETDVIGAAVEDRLFQPAPNDLAYLIYTSGSTGLPKGAMVEHRGMINHLLAKVEDLQLGPQDVVAATASPSFDISVWQFFSALVVGASTRIYDDDTARDPRALMAATDADRVTVLELVPSMLRAVLDGCSGPAGSAGQPELTALRWLLLTGEALPPDLAAGGLRRWPHLALMNAYGPTECSDDVTHHVLREPPAAAAARVPIGFAIRNTRLYVLDDRQQPVPVGAAGELCIGGAGVGRGYRLQPGRTAAVFVPDPYSDEPGGRLYRSGDRVRRLPDGSLDFLGRLDHQVKVRGFRIELGEIENTLLGHPHVADATVILREDVVGDQRLVAYAVLGTPNDGSDGSDGSSGSGDSGDEPVAELQALCARTLASYAVPAAIVLLPKLPLTPNGKLDRKALPAPRYADEPSISPPRPGIEEQVAAVWRSVLGVQHIDRNADFFALGGHSLLAMRVVASLPAAGLGEVELRELFEAPTLAEFSRRALGSRTRALVDSGPVRLAGPQRPPLSFAQQRLWFLESWEPGSSLYNLPMALRLDGDLDVGALGRAVQQLAERHESLRTTFGTDGDEACQIVHDLLAIPLPVLDLGAVPAAGGAADRCAAMLAETEARKPFDLGTGPLLRAVLIRLDDHDHLLLLSVHHIVFDGWSSVVLMRDLGEFYTAAVDRRPAELPELPVQYADYAGWQRRLLDDERIEAEVEHWRTALDGAPALLELPTDRPRPLVQTHQGANLARRWPRELCATVRDLAGQESATPFMVLLAAVAATLGRLSGQDDVVIGTPVAGRSHRSLDDVVGFFVNTLPLRVNLAGNPSLRELLRRVRQSSLDAFAHQELPFERLVEGLAPQRSLSHSPVFQVMLVLHNLPPVERGLSAPGLRVQRFGDEVVGATARFDLTISMREDDGLHLNAEYDTALFERTTVDRMLGQARLLLARGLDRPDAPLAEFDLLDADELATVRGFGTGPERLADERGAADLIEARATATPDSVALAAAGTVLTYRALWARAGELADRLTAAGAGPGALVELRLERSPELVTALVAVLRAGAGFSWSSDGTDRADADRRLTLGRDDRGWVLTPAERPSAAGYRPDAPAGVSFGIDPSDRTAGAVITHAGLADQLRWLQERFPGSAADRLLAQARPGSDGAVRELLWPLAAGVPIVLAAADDATADPAGRVRLLDEQAVSSAEFTPSELAGIVNGPAARWLPSLRRIVCGAEQLPADLAGAAQRVLPATRLHQLYRPSGAAAPVAAAEFDDANGWTFGEVAAGTRIQLLDRTLAACPVGVPGEVYVTGDQVATGYLDRPGRTAARLLPDPSGPPGARMLRTGDLGRWQPDGRFQVLAGRDAQVSVRGYRVPLGAVEAALRSHPGVTAAAAAGKGSGGAARLIGYVVLPEATDDEAAAIRETCAARLPGHLVPHAIVLVPALPQAPDGTLDRTALPQPPAPAGHAGDGPSRRTTATEDRLAAVWQQVLGIDQVSPDDDFFALGGHSLLAMKVQSRVLAAFGIALPLRRLFELPTVAELAAELEALFSSGDAVRKPVAAPAPIGRIDRAAYRRH